MVGTGTVIRTRGSVLSAATFYVALALLGALLLPGFAPWSWVLVVVLAGLAAWRR
jgi:hypothetical protein